MKRGLFLFLLAISIWVGGNRAPTRQAFINGHVLTQDHSNRTVQAVLLENQRIVAVGSNTDIAARITKNTTVVDLLGKTMLPGFVDAHSHFPVPGVRAVSIDLSSPPMGDTTSIATLLAHIENAAAAQPAGDWLLGYNYDNAAFADGNHPQRAELDIITPDHPVYLWHSSGHMGVANSLALERLGISEQSVPQPGGSFGRDEASGRLTGLLQEKAAPPLSRFLSEFSILELFEILTVARDEYLANGVTTIQNGYVGKRMAAVLRWSQRLGIIPQRIVVWPAHEKMRQTLLAKNISDNTHPWFTVGAVKLIADGSPQGLTAHLSEPYYDAAGTHNGYAGIAAISADELNGWVLRYHLLGYQLAIHGNGDAAIDNILNAVSIAQQALPRSEARHILVHAQTIRHDQLERMHALHLSPSFFTAHTYFWGDWHRTRSLGPDRAAIISPAHWAGELGLRYSFHTDAPVTPMQPMQMLWSATRRETSTGFVLGQGQRVSMQQALRAITIDAAWQNHLESTRGSIEVGKVADLVVLSDNPMSAVDVRQIRVLRTYIGGELHYER